MPNAVPSSRLAFIIETVDPSTPLGPCMSERKKRRRKARSSVPRSAAADSALHDKSQSTTNRSVRSIGARFSVNSLAKSPATTTRNGEEACRGFQEAELVDLSSRRSVDAVGRGNLACAAITP